MTGFGGDGGLSGGVVIQQEPPKPPCRCGHPAHIEGRCGHEVWDDGQWLEEVCECDEYSPVPPVAPTNLGGGEGVLGAFVWPVYVGLSNGQPDPACTGEPFMHPDYQRGQITWTTMPNGEIIGRAVIHVPAGSYTHLTYHYGPSIWPSGPQLMGYRQNDHGLRFPQAGTATIDPINEGDWLQEGQPTI